MSNTKKTGNKWFTEDCGRCGDAHHGFSGKIDSKGIEYVVCTSNKRMNVSGTGMEGNSFAFPTIWKLENKQTLC